MPPNDSHAGWEPRGRLIPALVLVLIGVIFLLNNLNVLPGFDFWRLWPVILIAIGLSKVVEGGRGAAGGAIILGIGAVFLADNLNFLPMPVWQFWPVILIALGFGLLFDRLPWQWHDRSGGAGHTTRWSQSGNPNLSAVFSGGKRKFDGEDFKGAVVSTVFGGFEIDLRRAYMSGESAVLQVDAVFGGCDIKIPETWNVVLKGGAVFGGYSDETHHPAPGTPGAKTLIVKGGAVFGGVVVKN